MKSGLAFEVISPAITIKPVFARVSSATRELESSASKASSTASEIWSHILSGWPSETDSDVNKKSFSGINGGSLESSWSKLDIKQRRTIALSANSSETLIEA